MLNKKYLPILGLSVFTPFVTSTAIAAIDNLDVYGKIHLSADHIDNGDTTDTTIGSNSSRIGFKGSKSLKHDIKAIWKLESDIDVSGERGDLKARNRYLGLEHAIGTIIVGYHDSPYKTLGAKAGVFHDTIAERRGILGAADGSNKMNIRGKNGVMYKSPKWNDLEFRFMRSAGDDSESSLDQDPITSTSLLYATKKFYLGVAFEEQTKASVDAQGLRFSGGISLGNTKLNLVYEDMTSDSNDKFERSAYGGSLTHKLGDTTLKAQVFLADDYKNRDKSAGILWGLGADYKLDKSFTVYGVVAGVDNDENANIVLAGSGHGEKYKPASPGDELFGVSTGMIYKF